VLSLDSKPFILATPAPAPSFTPYQKLVIALIAVLQFTVVLDFMVMSPLSDFLIKSLDITPAQFGIVVSSYAFSAALSGILAAGFADRYDRKKILLFFYTGFLAGTLFCGLATTYPTLVAARVLTGLFGGVIGATGMAIVADLFDLSQRGRALSFTQLAFSASQVLGIPISLIIANRWGWNAPFIMIVGLALILGLLVVWKMRPVDKHLALGQNTRALTHLWNTVAKRRYRIGFFTTAFLSIGAFMMMPFGSVFAVNNLGVSPDDLFIVFMSTGVISIIVMPVIGRLSDKFDKLKVFAIGSVGSIIMVLYYTNLGPTPLVAVITVNMLMFSMIMSRMVPSTALVSALPEPKDRGAFMSITASLQQLAGGVGSMVAGMIVFQKTNTSPLENFDVLGIVVAACVLITLGGLYRVDQLVKNTPKAQPVPSQGQAA
jgi:predicted MFS family arabinose efflux permease